VSRVSAWNRGQVVDLVADDPESLLVQFDNEPNATLTLLKRHGPLIAPEGTFTDDVKWRENIKKDD